MHCLQKIFLSPPNPLNAKKHEVIFSSFEKSKYNKTVQCMEANLNQQPDIKYIYYLISIELMQK
jgi:hypothetical protein